MTRALAIWILGSLALASALTPVLYSGLLWLVEGADWPYRRIFNRVAMLCGLLGLYLLRRRLPWAAAGRAWSAESWRERSRRVGFGAALSLATGALAIPIIHATTAVRTAELSAGFLFPRLAEAVGIGVLVAALEESFFRVIVLRGLEREWPARLALLGSALVFAFVHFLTPDKSYVYPGYSVLVGFEYLGAVFGRMLEPSAWTGFTGLFLVGLALAHCMQRRDSLALCIGMHAGWVVAAKLGVWYTVPPVGAAWAPGWQRYYLLEQPWTWAVIVGAALIVARRPRGRAGLALPPAEGNGPIAGGGSPIAEGSGPIAEGSGPIAEGSGPIAEGSGRAAPTSPRRS